MRPIKKLANIEVVEAKFACRSLGVITVTSSPIFLFTSINLRAFVPHSSFWHMVRGKALSDDLRDVLLHMAQSLDISAITYYTGCKRRTIQQILSDYRKRGSVARQHLRKDTLRGHRRAMKGQDIRVSHHSSTLFHFLMPGILCSFYKALFVTAQMLISTKCRSCWSRVGGLILGRPQYGGRSLGAVLR